MLVVSRKAGESIVIGDDIKVIVKRIESNRVGIGIDAPRETVIRRTELTGKDDCGQESRGQDGG